MNFIAFFRPQGLLAGPGDCTTEPYEGEVSEEIIQTTQYFQCLGCHGDGVCIGAQKAPGKGYSSLKWFEPNRFLNCSYRGKRWKTNIFNSANVKWYCIPIDVFSASFRAVLMVTCAVEDPASRDPGGFWTIVEEIGGGIQNNPIQRMFDSFVSLSVGWAPAFVQFWGWNVQLKTLCCGTQAVFERLFPR